MAKPESVFIYIGTYPSEAAARDDYGVVKDLHAAGAVGTYDAAVVTKDDSGKVHVSKDEMATRHGAWGGAAVGAFIGVLTFRVGLRGSYFALVTLAFAEVLRIIASVAPITGGGVGILVKLDLRAAALQFESRAMFYWFILALVAVALMIAHAIERSRFGTWLIAVRENEDAAKALGVNAPRVKLGAMVLSAAITAAAGCFYVQYFLFIDSGIAYGTRLSIEALLTPIIGGAGTVFGPLLGALVVQALGEGAKLIAGDAPGLNLVVYGAVLVLVIAFAPRGLVRLVDDANRWLSRSAKLESAHG